METLSKPSTYTEAHRKYYNRYKALIAARRRKYMKEYKRLWYKKNRDKILAERALQRLSKENVTKKDPLTS